MNENDQYHQMGMSGMSPSGFPNPEPIQCFIDSEIGMTMGEETVKQLPDGSWIATCPIGTLFGSEVEGQVSGTGSTKEVALSALKQARKDLNDSLWA